MTTTAKINQPAPQPEIECWAQGYEPLIHELTGQVILIEVIWSIAQVASYTHCPK